MSLQRTVIGQESGLFNDGLLVSVAAAAVSSSKPKVSIFRPALRNSKIDFVIICLKVSCTTRNRTTFSVSCDAWENSPSLKSSSSCRTL